MYRDSFRLAVVITNEVYLNIGAEFRYDLTAGSTRIVDFRARYVDSQIRKTMSPVSYRREDCATLGTDSQSVRSVFNIAALKYAIIVS